MSRSWLYRLLGPVAEVIDRKVGWHKLPVPISIVALIGLRERLRERNLHDTSRLAASPPLRDERSPTTRTVDGSFNDPKNPSMGQAKTPFGRNVPLEHGHPETDWAIRNNPNPRTVSRELLTRDPFQPATTLNLLAAAWLQFMIRDWVSHVRGDRGNMWELELAEDDPWRNEPKHKDPMPIPRTPRASAPSGNSPPVYTNTETHWWDGSQLYGSTREHQSKVRAGEDGKLDLDEEGTKIPERILTELAREPGWWAGLALMFTVFAREHNAICDRLRREYPSWSSDDIFERARLINAALMAKIHTVEWTTALLGHPTLQVAMNANWWGLATERIYKLYGGRLSKSEIVSGIPGSPKNHFGVPYSMTEEFVAVYRMHPMIPDHFDFRSVNDNESLAEQGYTLRDISGPHVRDLLEQVSMTNLVYSFGTTYPGALTLHNYPRFLQDFERPDGEFMDLAATDILRTRELGVPRYNEFRRLLGLSPARTFEELADNQAWVEELRRVYDEVEQVDLMIGLFAEPKPAGFGIGDTAFRIFILMASRRLNSDRFFTTDYTPKVYTQVGMDWILENDMSSVLRRHFPELLPSLYRTKNAFAPWPRSRGGV